MSLATPHATISQSAAVGLAFVRPFPGSYDAADRLTGVIDDIRRAVDLSDVPVMAISHGRE
jgi:hypothetical protein